MVKYEYKKYNKNKYKLAKFDKPSVYRKSVKLAVLFPSVTF